MIRFLTGIALMASMLFVSSCEEDKEEYKVKVIVVDQNQLRIPGIAVRIYADRPSSVVDITTIANSSGEASFKYDKKAFLDIEASNDTLRGCSSVELLEGKEVSRIVIVKPLNDSDNGCV